MDIFSSLMNEISCMNEKEPLPYHDESWFEKDLYFKSTGTLSGKSKKQFPSAPFQSLRSALLRGDRQSRKQDFWASDISHKTFTSSVSIRDSHYVEMKYNHLNQVIECYDGIGDGTANELEDEIKGYIISNNALWNLKHDITHFGTWKYQDAERKHQPSQ